jgi:hypothetical protein
MSNISVKNFDQDGVMSEKPNAKLSVVELLTGKATRLTLEPGWR